MYLTLQSPKCNVKSREQARPTCHTRHGPYHLQGIEAPTASTGHHTCNGAQLLQNWGSVSKQYLD